ncbi:MAG: peptidoglycan bridge formation glycyltransferase FemA/FemB family protein [Anaerolineae bacterium]|nr:peptidoglycan bridge formation glycyltransferase FemA/FemB family protein [Anaerolineae bacterium]
MDVSVSEEGLDPEWDSFLETLSDGLYQQSSLWAKVKAKQGWKHVRLVVKDGIQIVGGVQVLLRSLPLVGAVGYVSKGPVVASDDPMVQEFILDQLDRLARKERIPFLKIQPPYGSDELAEQLAERGGVPSVVPVTPLATFRVDLRPKPDDILLQMDRNTRSNIRRAERRGVVVRRGTEADLPTFFNLKKIHAKQRGYGLGSEENDYNLFSILGDHFRFFLAEYDGQVLAAKSNFVFGDVTIDYHLVDNGLHRNLNAQSLLHWKAMLWGKECGCAWYDFGGIALPLAKAIMNNEPLPDHPASGRAQFKRSFGGQLMFRPGVYDVSFIRPRRLTVRVIPVLTKLKPLLSFLIGGSLTSHVQDMDQTLTRLQNLRSSPDSLEKDQ